MRHVAPLLLLSVTAAAQVPAKVGYQGFLRALDGGTVTGLKELTFALYDSPEGGAPRWTERQPVLFKDGHYVVTLGEASGCDAGPCTGIPADVFSPPADLYLELSVDGAPFRPRQQVTSAPFAVTAFQLRGGTVEAASVRAAGAVEASSARVSGPLEATSARLGAVQASSVTSTGPLSGTSLSTTGELTAAGYRTRSGALVLTADGGYVAPTINVFACPYVASDPQCRAGTCGGQLSTSRTCVNYQYVSAACTAQSAACSFVGRILPP